MSKSIRIRTTPNGEEKYVKLKLEQDFDFLEILSLKIRQEDAYTNFCSNYGVVAGRVSVNDGFGLPNIRVSIFIPISDEDNENSIISEIYPYVSTVDTNRNGVRYNLLPKRKQHPDHTPVGTFPDKREVLDDETTVEVYEKYYKYTTKTNEAGDFMLFGVPVGQQEMFYDLDVSDIGFLSLRPYEMMAQGNPESNFESRFKFKSSNDLDELTQIRSAGIPIIVKPFWCDTLNLGQEIGITRQDIPLKGMDLKPTAIFMGSIFSDDEKDSLNKNCRPRKNMGQMNDLITSTGKIEIIRRTQRGDIEFYKDLGEDLIDENGNWSFQMPMNLRKVITSEDGTLIPSPDGIKGVATEADVRFRVSMNDSGDDGRLRTRAKMLIPNMLDNYEFDSFGREELRDAENAGEPVFKINDELSLAPPSYQDDPGNEYNYLENFFTFRWKKVYTIRQHIGRFQPNKGDENKNFIGIKDIARGYGVNKMPFNRIDGNVNPLYFILCYLLTIFAFIVAIINGLINFINSFITMLCQIKIPCGVCVKECEKPRKHYREAKKKKIDLRCRTAPNGGKVELPNYQCSSGNVKYYKKESNGAVTTSVGLAECTVNANPPSFSAIKSAYQDYGVVYGPKNNSSSADFGSFNDCKSWRQTSRSSFVASDGGVAYQDCDGDWTVFSTLTACEEGTGLGAGACQSYNYNSWSDEGTGDKKDNCENGCPDDCSGGAKLDIAIVCFCIALEWRCILSPLLCGSCTNDTLEDGVTPAFNDGCGACRRSCDDCPAFCNECGDGGETSDNPCAVDGCCRECCEKIPLIKLSCPPNVEGGPQTSETPVAFPTPFAPGTCNADLILPCPSCNGIEFTGIKDWVDCTLEKLASQLGVVTFEFYNDWVNGSLYFPLIKRKLKTRRRRKKSGQLKKDKFCDFNCYDGGVTGTQKYLLDPTQVNQPGESNNRKFDIDHGKPDYIKVFDPTIGFTQWYNLGGHGHHQNRCNVSHLVEKKEFIKRENDCVGAAQEAVDQIADFLVPNIPDECGGSNQGGNCADTQCASGVQACNIGCPCPDSGYNDWVIKHGIVKWYKGNLYYASIIPKESPYHNNLFIKGNLFYPTNITELGSSTFCDIDDQPFIMDSLETTSYRISEQETGGGFVNLDPYIDLGCKYANCMGTKNVVMSSQLGIELYDFRDDSTDLGPKCDMAFDHDDETREYFCQRFTTYLGGGGTDLDINYMSPSTNLKNNVYDTYIEYSIPPTTTTDGIENGVNDGDTYIGGDKCIMAKSSRGLRGEGHYFYALNGGDGTQVDMDLKNYPSNETLVTSTQKFEDNGVEGVSFHTTHTPYYFYFGLIPGKTALHKTVAKFFADKVTLPGDGDGNYGNTTGGGNTTNEVNPQALLSTCLNKQ